MEMLSRDWYCVQIGTEFIWQLGNKHTFVRECRLPHAEKYPTFVGQRTAHKLERKEKQRMSPIIGKVCLREGKVCLCSMVEECIPQCRKKTEAVPLGKVCGRRQLSPTFHLFV